MVVVLEEQKPVVSPWEAALVIIVTFFVFLFIGAFLLFTVGEAPTLVVGELLILAVPLIYLLSKRINIKTYVKLNPNPKYLLIGLGCGALLLLLNIIVTNGLTAVLGQSQAVQQSNETISTLSGTSFGFAAVVASLSLAGICEEFAFRGFLQNSLFKSLHINPKYSKYSFAIAVVIAAGVFGLFHFDPQGVYTLSAFITGLALGGIYHKWNYTTSATAHASMNLMVLALVMFGF